MRITIEITGGDAPLHALQRLADDIGGELRCTNFGRQEYAVVRRQPSTSNENVVKLPRRQGQYVPAPPDIPA